MTAVVVGAARSGVALAQHLTRRHERVRVADRKAAADLSESLAQMPAGIELRLGGYDNSVLDGADVVYASPGVPWDSELLNEARARGIRVSSEIDLFLELNRVGLVRPGQLLVCGGGAISTTLEQPPAARTRFGFAAGCRLRLAIKESERAA